MHFKVDTSREVTSEVAASLLEMLIENLHKQKIPDRHSLLMKFLKLGLLDELIQLLAQAPSSGDEGIARSLEHIEKLIENRYFNTLDAVNPVLKKITLDLISRSLQDEDDKDLTMSVITAVIFTITIFLIKLDASDVDMIDRAMPDLEIAFEYLAKYLNTLTFTASDTLVRATNFLVVEIKSKLDILADNELVRDSFKTLIETVAGRCLIESRYKSAAMLYSQIEDNLNAVKALMRAGDVDTVINFALLLRDINVDRITINYLKHLKVDIKIIEEFVARTKG